MIIDSIYFHREEGYVATGYSKQRVKLIIEENIICRQYLLHT